MAHAPSESLPLALATHQSTIASLPASRIVTLDIIPTPLSPTQHPMQLRLATSLALPSPPAKLCKRGDKYFAPELLDLFEVMARILPIGPLEWEKVAELHGKQWPGRDVESLRRKYTNTHRRKAPTEQPDCPPELRGTKLVNAAIGSKAELTDCTEEYDMELETDDQEDGEGAVARVGFIQESVTDIEPSPQRYG